MAVNKDKRTGKYYVSFYYKNSEGKLIRKKKEGFKKRAEAVKFMEEFLAKNEGKTNMLFSSFVELYLKDAYVNTRITTFQNKKYIITSKILPFFKDFYLNNIEALDIRKWQNELKSEKLSDTYLRTINNQLNAIFNYAVKYYNLTSNPILKTQKIGKKNAEDMNFWTKEEFNLFKSYIKDDFEFTLITEILFFTGIRKGELLALTLNNFDFENKKMYIQYSYQRINKEDILTLPKTPRSRRTITLPNFLCEKIKEYASKRYDYKSDERLFIVSKYCLHRKLNNIIKKYNLKKIRIHDFRHSHVALLIEMNVPILLIAERLGHDSPETTLKIYGHLYPNKHQEIAEQLNVLESQK